MIPPSSDESIHADGDRAIERRAFLQRSALAALGGGLLVAGGGVGTVLQAAAASAAQQSTPIRFQLSWVKDSEWAGFFLADADKRYRRNGVGVEFLSGGPNGPYAEQTIAGGAADMGSSTSFTFIATGVKSGADLVVLGAVDQRSPACLVSLPDNPVRSLKDVVGKRVGSDPAYEVLLKSLLKSAGLDPDITVVPVGSDGSSLAAGDCDVLVGFITNQPITLRKQGLKPVVLMFDKIGFPSYVGLMVTSREFLDANRDAVVGFLRATSQGWSTALKDPSKAVEVTVGDYGADLGLDPDKELASVKANNKLVTSALTRKEGLFSIDPAFVAGPIYDGLAKVGFTDLPDPTSYIDLSPLREAYASKGSSS
jgi:ABC-type nitrate/sulfonate/bicarbonate transport system substrate-binding protein